MMHVRSASISYATIERAATAHRWSDRAMHLPMIGFVLGGGIAAVLWLGILWAVHAVLN